MVPWGRVLTGVNMVDSFIYSGFGGFRQPRCLCSRIRVGLPENVNFCGLKPTLLFQVAFVALCRMGLPEKEAGRRAGIKLALAVFQVA